MKRIAPDAVLHKAGVTQRKESAWRVFLRLWDRTAIYMPLLLMGALALGTYWLVRNTPIFNSQKTIREVRHEVDYFMYRFTIKTFDEGGKLKSEVHGAEARHFVDTDILEIDQARIRSIDAKGLLTTATANRAYANSDGSEVQLTGNARVLRESSTDDQGKELPQLEFRGEFLHVFLNDERVKSHKPVVLIRGNDQFAGDALTYDNLDRVAQLTGRVKGVLIPQKGGQVDQRTAPRRSPLP